MFAVSFSHPADVLKVRLQLTGECNPAKPTLRARDIWLVAQRLAVTEGPGSLYRGISAAWLRQATFGTLRHGGYGVLEAAGKDARNQVSLSWRLLSGLVSGSISALLANPADVVLIRMQADGAWPLAHRRGYRHALHGLWSVWRGEGWQALYRGSGPTALRAALVTMAQLPTYEELKGRALSMGISNDVRLHLACAMASGTVACLATQPVDCVKTRIINMQQCGVNYLGPVDVVRKTLATEGPLAFYKGLSATFIRLWPHTVLLWLGQEFVNARLR
ncbi:unnamed protein product [Cladocopium goreaui]|uniref:Mitochondrial 2-oxoglutarate/malate carrier protein n=1 Tax=Cladocopium goreaui TaxID=2562237 RepID=A0A9P1GDR6_9DINO|nr:unnamed protein product [Cladocopium goreaui]